MQVGINNVDGRSLHEQLILDWGFRENFPGKRDLDVAASIWGSREGLERGFQDKVT